MKRTNRTVRTVLAAAAAFSIGLPAIASGSERPWADERAALSAPEALTAARDLIETGRPVEARAILMKLMEGGGAALADRERDRGYRLLAEASRRVRALPADELSIQRAELALKEGDLRGALEQVDAVLDMDDLPGANLVRAEQLRDRIEVRRAQLAPMIAGALDEASRAIDAGELAEAKVYIAWLNRSGMELNQQQRSRLTDWQMQIVAAERRAGRTFDAGGDTLTLSAQPGIRRMDEEPREQTGERTRERQPDPVDEVIDDAEREEALRLIRRADEAFQGRRLNDALATYEDVRTRLRDALNESERRELDSKIFETQRLLQGDPSGEQVLDRAITARERQRQEALTVFNNQLEAAERAIATGDIEGARNNATAARLTIERNRAVFDEQSYERYLNQARDLAGRVEAAQERLAQREAAERATQLERLAREAEREREARRRRQINEAILRVRDLQMQRRYREALDVIEQEILFVDPNNVQGQLLRDIISDTALYRESAENTREFHRHAGELRVENERAAIPPLDIIEFPPDWPSLSANRTLQTAYSEPAENRQVLARLRTQRIPQVDISNTFQEALEFVQVVGQIDVDVDWDALEEINVRRDDPVTLSLRNKPLQAVLERVLARVGDPAFGEKAWYTVQDGILLVSSDRALRRNTYLEIYDVRDLVVEIPEYRNAPQFDLNQILQGGRGGGGQSPFQDPGDQDVERMPLEERIDRMKDIIRELVDPGEWRDQAGETGAIYDWQSQLLITQTAENHRQIRSLLSKLRSVRAMQINVETRFLLVSQDFFEQIGFDLDVYFNATSDVVQNAQALDPTILPSDFFGSSGRYQRNVTGGLTQTGDDPTSFGNPGPQQSRWTPIGVVQDSLGIAGALMPSEGIAATVLGRSPAMGISGQFLDDIQVDFLVQATQADRRSVQLTAPRLTFTNGQVSNIYVATQQGFISDLTPVVSDSAVGFDPTIDVISEGVRMIVEGTITADRRYVILDIDAAIAQIEGFSSEPVTAIAGGQLVTSADTQSFVQVPRTTVTRVSTTVTVPDQGTLLLGGQRIVNEVEVESGVPVLSKLPVVNRFFTNRIMSKEEQTLMILVKPTILIQNEQEEQNFPGITESLGLGIGG